MHLSDLLENIYLETDNKAIKKLLSESLEKFQKDVFIKMSCLENCANGFETISYIRKRSEADVDFRPALKQKAKTLPKISKSIQHPDLYIELKQWRDNLAEENNVPVYHILPQKTILELLDKLPTTIQELKTIKGIGQIKAKQFGEDIIGLIKEYCIFNEITPKKIEVPVKKKKEHIDTKLVSFKLYRTGKTLAEIAKERGVTIGTIEGHLAHYVGKGELKIAEIVSADKIQKVLNFIKENPHSSVSEIKYAFGDDLTFGEVRLIIQHKQWLQKV
jgi:uncharacterized protein YpbB